MCHFITMVVPGSTDLEKLEAELNKVHRELYIVENRFVRRLLKKSDIYFCAAPKFCDCGTSLGIAHQEDKDPHKKDYSSEIARLRKKGWSETKIKRALRDSIKAKKKHYIPHPEGKADNWPDLITGLAVNSSAKYVGIMLHMYSGEFENYPKELSKKVIKLDEKLNDHLLHMHENTLYIFKA